VQPSIITQGRVKNSRNRFGLGLKETNHVFFVNGSFLAFPGTRHHSLQNNEPLELKFITWSLPMTLTALILYSSLIGGAIVAVLALPKLVRKSLDVRRSNKKTYKLKEKILELEKGHDGKSQVE
jgi:hypothetical protein